MKNIPTELRSTKTILAMMKLNILNLILMYFSLNCNLLTLIKHPATILKKKNCVMYIVYICRCVIRERFYVTVR